MTAARILPRDEWSKLEGSNAPLFGWVNPGDVDIIVVEDDGRIVACLTVLRVTHFEGLWVDPERKGIGAARALLRQAMELARVRGDQWAMGAAEKGDIRMARLLDRLGGKILPIDPYVLAIPEESVCRQ